MTIFSAVRGLTFLARDVFEAALYLIPAPGLSGYDVDGADLLAEREARVDVTEAAEAGMSREEFLGPYEAVGWDDDYAPQIVCVLCFRPSGNCDCTERLLGRPSDCGLGNSVEPPLTADELVAVRQLIEERFGEPHAPVASASPPTPADATGLTLANDPLSVHERHMRRLLGEDKGGAR